MYSPFILSIFLAGISSPLSLATTNVFSDNSDGCKIQIISYTRDPAMNTMIDESSSSEKVGDIVVSNNLTTHDHGDEQYDFECEIDSPSDEDSGGSSSTILPIDLSNAQKQTVLEKVSSGDIIPNHSILFFSKEDDDVRLSDDAIYVSPEADISASIGVREGQLDYYPNAKRVIEGELPTLVVRVKDSLGQVVPRSAKQVGDDIFGTLGDPLNPSSQLQACSHGKVKLIPGPDIKGKLSAPGVIDVKIPIEFQNDSRAVRKAVTAAVEKKLGIDLPGPYSHVLYALHSCVNCSWLGYAVLNGWVSVYKGKYSGTNGVVMHELGHNFGLLHSGEDKANYGDKSCVMGASGTHTKDDGARMCFNAAKSWQLGWYNDRTVKIGVNDAPWFGTIIGVTNYSNNPNKRPVVIKLEREEKSKSDDYYIAFNDATGINSDSGEAIHQVTIVKQSGNGDSPGQSWLLSKLSAGEHHSFDNFDGSGKTLTVSVKNIDLTADPAYADISICLGSCCKDSPTKFFWKGQKKRCKWALKAGKCNKSKIASHCPEKCDSCPQYRCTDSKLPFQYDNKQYTCKGIKKMDTEEREQLCKKGQVSNTCRKTCKVSFCN